ncbi:hypothetical protein HN011_001618 [Eciton burchellii]|nr:hypothetical protein HN011_001618 [Eciton burchellii]
MDVTRTDYSDERAARDATNRRRTTRLGYVGGAVIQPNAQVCRRLAGASQECSPPHIPPANSRSGWAPPRCSPRPPALIPLPPTVPLPIPCGSFSGTLQLGRPPPPSPPPPPPPPPSPPPPPPSPLPPPLHHHYYRQLRHAAQVPAHGRNGPR